jgi:hypothetical protein
LNDVTISKEEYDALIAPRRLTVFGVDGKPLWTHVLDPGHDFFWTGPPYLRDVGSVRLGRELGVTPST